MNGLENLLRPYIPLFVEGAVFTGFCTAGSVLGSIAGRIEYLGPRPAAIAGSIAWMGFVATQKLAEVAIKQFTEQYVSKSKYFTVPLSLVTSFSLANLVLVKLKLIPDSTTTMKNEDFANAKMEELLRVLAFGVMFTNVLKRQDLFNS